MPAQLGHRAAADTAAEGTRISPVAVAVPRAELLYERLRGYLRDPSGDRAARGILPSDSAHTRALLRLFETEKAFYELMYELNNRPDWVWIPVAGALAHRGTAAGRS